MKVWIVTAGWYSEYHIVAVFTEDQRQKADNCARMVKGNVEEWEVNASDWLRDKVWFWIESGDDGRVQAIAEKSEVPSEELSRQGLPPLYTPAEAKFMTNRWTVWVQARTREGAIKVGLDRIAQHKAELEGIT